MMVGRRNTTPTPRSKKGMYTTTEDYQTSIDIAVYEGERSSTSGAIAIVRSKKTVSFYTITMYTVCLSIHRYRHLRRARQCLGPVRIARPTPEIIRLRYLPN